MNVIEALEIANAPQAGEPFRILAACGFTALHLRTAVTARLKLSLPERSVIGETGIYGDICGTLESAAGEWNAVVAVLEWADIDPRLGWRTMRGIDGSLLTDAEARLGRFHSAIESLTRRVPVAVALPALPQAPVFHTAPGELHPIQARLHEMVYRFAAGTSASVIHPASLPPPTHDLRAELLNGTPYPFAYFDALAVRLVESLLPPNPKKGLITDLDETLWAGILGDNGVDGISWDFDHKTQFHALYQELLNSLAGAGTLIGVASKNDPDLVRDALKRSDLAVRPSILFPIEAHWESKVQSVARIIEAWNIGSDSVVFVDDNPLEIEQIKTAFPDVECVAFRKDDATLLETLRRHFGKRAVREEDRLRAQSLRTGQEIRQASGASLDSLLEGAQAKVTVHWLRQRNDPRALELVNKTNQFNLNGRRFDSAEWTAMITDSANHLLVAEYEDRFGKLGKIAVLSGQEEAGAFRLRVWVMSCRAFSRRVEQLCLKLLFDRWDALRMDFEPTPRNGPLQRFLEQIGAGAGILEAKTFQRHCPPLFHLTEVIEWTPDRSD
jgi:FkbH-like protein